MPEAQERVGDIRIGERLRQAEEALAERQARAVSAREICNAVRTRHGVSLSPSTYSLLRSDRRAPTVQQLVALARVFEVTPEFLLGELGLAGRGGVQWARRIPALNPTRKSWVSALEGLLSGRPLDAAFCANVGLQNANLSDPEGRRVAEWEIGRLAHSAVFLGIAELKVSSEALDQELAEAVRTRLVGDERLPAQLRGRLHVAVVKNPVHASFVNGGHMGPLIVGNHATQAVGEFLRRSPHVTELGLAGGFHVASLVRQLGFGELDWPDRTYRIYPLTIEPFNKQISLADALVGGLAYRLSAILGPDSVQAYTLRAFGYLTEDGDVSLRQRSITTVLDQLTELDVAIMGVGDAHTPDGPLQRVLAMQGYRLASPESAVADVCLNPLDENGELLPLRQRSSRVEQLIGIDVEQLRRMACVENKKQVVLLASGAHKARSTRAVVRGGFVNHVVCDDVLARALLALD